MWPTIVDDMDNTSISHDDNAIYGDNCYCTGF